ncbi:hypothetical protein Tco_0499626, partial [Tanacetum coccineum]
MASRNEEHELVDIFMPVVLAVVPLVLLLPVRIYQISQENRQKTGKHRHEEQKSTKEAKDSKPKPRKVNP